MAGQASTGQASPTGKHALSALLVALAIHSLYSGPVQLHPRSWSVAVTCTWMVYVLQKGWNNLGHFMTAQVLLESCHRARQAQQHRDGTAVTSAMHVLMQVFASSANFCNIYIVAFWRARHACAAVRKASKHKSGSLYIPTSV